MFNILNNMAFPSLIQLLCLRIEFQVGKFTKQFNLTIIIGGCMGLSHKLVFLVLSHIYFVYVFCLLKENATKSLNQNLKVNVFG